MNTITFNNSQAIAETTLSASNMFKNISSAVTKMNKAAMTPVMLLKKYYEHVLERKLSGRQMTALVVAQVAFFAAFLPAEAPLLFRVGSIAFCIAALLKCRNELAK